MISVTIDSAAPLGLAVQHVPDAAQEAARRNGTGVLRAARQDGERAASPLAEFLGQARRG